MAAQTDEGKWRATFGLPYPTVVEEIKDASKPLELMNRKVLFSVTKKSLESFRFTTCQFLIPGTAAPPQGQLPGQDAVQGLTFRGCRFAQSFLGGVSFMNCRFVDCMFQSCDFGNTKFYECEFSDCAFAKCTSWETAFTRTLIDAAAFMRGQCVPIENFQGLAQSEVDDAHKKFYRTQAVIANQLVGSLSSGTQSDYYDSALYYSKLYNFHVRRSQLFDWKRYRRLTHSGYEAAFALIRDWVRMGFTGFNLLLTKGGTSVFRLLVLFVIFNLLLFPQFVLPDLNLKHAESPTFCNDANYVRRIATSAELFLAFGYGNYTPQNQGSHIWLTLYTSLGIVWYAFLIPVLLRRVYK